MTYKINVALPDRQQPRVTPFGSWTAALLTPRALGLAAGGCLILAALAVLSRFYLELAMVGLVASLGMVFLIGATMHARVNGALLTWLVISPLAYYFFSFPTEKPVFTFDRFIILVLTGAVIFVSRSEATPLPRDLTRTALVWGIFIFFAFTSLIPVWGDLGVAGSRLIIEGFVFPGLMALFVIRVFPAQRFIRPMHTLVGITAIYCALIAAAELATNTDLLPLPQAIFYGADQTGLLARVNGPFAANYCLATVGAISLFLLFFLRGLMEGRLSRIRTVFHWTAVAAAIAMALLPQFRTLAIALAIVLFLELKQNKRISVRAAVAAIVILVTFAIISLPALAPAFFENRIADPSNFYARVAQQQQTWDLFREHPINGAGFANFMQAIQNISSTNFRDVDAVNSAHNTLGSVLAETGITGALPYVAANILWFLAFFRLRRLQTLVASAAYRFFLYVFVCYWLMALTLTSAYDRDLNLWYMFACAVMYKLAISEQNPATTLVYSSGRKR